MKFLIFHFFVISPFALKSCMVHLCLLVFCSIFLFYFYDFFYLLLLGHENSSVTHFLQPSFCVKYNQLQVVLQQASGCILCQFRYPSRWSLGIQSQFAYKCFSKCLFEPLLRLILACKLHLISRLSICDLYFCSGFLLICLFDSLQYVCRCSSACLSSYSLSAQSCVFDQLMCQFQETKSS